LAATALGLLGAAAWSATVQVEVRDGAGQPVSGAVVFLESAQAQRAVRPLQGMEMAQEKKQFVPAVLAVTTGTPVHFPNRDAVRHHVYSFSPAKKFEIKLYKGTPSNPVVFDRPGVVLLGCNIHDQMVGWILVLDTPYFAHGGANGQPQGTAVLEQVPEGSYQLRTWHPGLPVGAPALTQTLEVDGAAADVRAAVRLTGLAP
jgi:plastocyanin